jgi:hypothetical protein
MVVRPVADGRATGGGWSCDRWRMVVVAVAERMAGW